jgi:hypothetical protein
VIVTKSATLLAKMLATTETPRFLRIGSLSRQKASTPTFASPIAFNMPAGVSQMRSGGLPGRGFKLRPFVQIPPSSATSKKSSYSSP